MLTVLTGCGEDLMDRINADSHNPGADKVDPKFQITDAIVSTAFSTLGGGYAWYAGSYTEQFFGDGGNVLMQAELRDPTITAAPSTFNNEWNNTYANLQNIRQIMEKCQPGGTFPRTDILGMAETLWVIDFSTLTLMHGDIPYSEALSKTVKAPKLDSQEAVYADLLRVAGDAIRHLAQAVAEGADNCGYQDLLYQGDCRKWLALAHAVKAQLLLQGSARYLSNIDEAAAEARAALDAGFEGAWLDIFTTTSNDNPWSAMFRSRQALGASRTLAALMEERSDPRLDAYASDLFGTGTLSAPAGDRALAMTSQQVGGPLWLRNLDAPAPLLSRSALLFIIAEAEVRDGLDATASLREAVGASFSEWATACGSQTVTETLTARAAADYALSLGAPTLKEVMVQKYIATASGESLVAWNDLRRCRALGEEWVRMLNPNNVQGGAERLPLRLPYGQSDFVSNPNVSAAMGSGNAAGQFIFSTPVWLFIPVRR